MAGENGKKRVHADGGGDREEDGGAAAGLDSRSAYDGEDVSEESLAQEKKDVAELAEKVMRYRETGPAAFASLLEKSLSQSQTRLSELISTAADTPATEGEERVPGADEMHSQLEDLKRRFAASRANLPNILRDLNECKERLDRVIIAKLSFQEEEQTENSTDDP